MGGLGKKKKKKTLKTNYEKDSFRGEFFKLTKQLTLGR
jgi:hypothetical protein